MRDPCISRQWVNVLVISYCGDSEVGDKVPPHIVTILVDHSVTYIIYHSGKDKPYMSDIVSK